MADEDDSQKTEDPTDKRKAKSRSDGDVASSQEIKSWMSLLGGAFGLLVLAPGIATDIRLIGIKFIASPEAISLDREHLRLFFAEVMLETAIAMAPIFGAACVVGLCRQCRSDWFYMGAKKDRPGIKQNQPSEGAQADVFAALHQ
jgi:flagellar biosynthetic protein FlhB